jgi:DNA-binding response OmpR family regulator
MPKKILIVDDEADIVALLAMRLKAHGYEITVASDGVSAVARAHREKPDLILLDIKMPAGGGVATFENLKRSADTMIIPVIFITAYPDDDTKHKTLTMGAKAFIAKPFDANDVLAKVRKALGETTGEDGPEEDTPKA